MAISDSPQRADLWLINTCTVKAPTMETLICKGKAASIPLVRKNKFVEIIPINVGCLGACTYCKTKHARGHLGSYTVDTLVQRLKTVVSEGRDIGANIPALLRALVAALPHRQKYNASNLHLTASGGNGCHPCVYLFLHVLVQSGRDSVLQGMKREYTFSEFRKIVDTLTRLVPETGTPAALMKRVPTLEVKKRSRSLTSLFESFTPYAGMEVGLCTSSTSSCTGPSWKQVNVKITSVGRWSVTEENKLKDESVQRSHKLDWAQLGAPTRVQSPLSQTRCLYVNDGERLIFIKTSLQALVRSVFIRLSVGEIRRLKSSQLTKPWMHGGNTGFTAPLSCVLLYESLHCATDFLSASLLPKLHGRLNLYDLEGRYISWVKVCLHCSDLNYAVSLERVCSPDSSPAQQMPHKGFLAPLGQTKARQWEASSSRGIREECTPEVVISPDGKQEPETGYPKVLPQYSKMSVCPDAPIVPFGPPPVKIEEIMPPRKPTRMPHGPANDVLEVDPEEFMEELNKLQARRAEETIHVIVEGAVPAGFVMSDWVCAVLAYHDMLVTVLAEDVKDLGEKCYNVVIKDERTRHKMEGMPVGDRVTVKVRIPKEVHIPFEIELKPGKGEVPRRIRVMLLPNPSVCIICRRMGHIGKHCLRVPGPVEEQQSRSRSGRTEDFARGNCPPGFTPPRRAVCEIELYVSGTNPPKFLGEWIDNRVGYAPPAILISPGQDIGRTLEDILASNFNWNPQRFSIQEDNFMEQAPNSFRFQGTDSEMVNVNVRTWNVGGLKKEKSALNNKKTKFRQYLRQVEEHRLSSMDLVYKFTKGKYFWNPAVSCSGGTLIVVKGPWESLVEDHPILVPGRVQCVQFKIGDMLVGLMNVYAPAGSSSERADFWNELVHQIPTQPSTWMVTGDFNFVEEELDKDGGEMRDKRTSRERAMWAQLVLAMG
ncbi:hypothetical protein SELMODRAFT_446506 [Selaginella moellendorffii]|uniref:Radical SAM core domain-containing protein n=1 Tax=Selaginella moellendorffii TaxID=88036 RepID=D8SS14_SELML|nr:hypothetical protein SELMODRAFT_446506 [Selaginella moellendorffii]